MRLLQGVVFCLVLVSGSYSQTLTMGYFVLPPHQMEGTGSEFRPRGAAIEYFEIIAEKAGFKVSWTSLPLLRLTKYLRTGKIDGSLNYPKFKIFESMMYFSKAPMYFGHGVFVVRKEAPLKTVLSIEDIKGLRIGVVDSKSDRYTPVMDGNRDLIILEKTPDLNWASQNLRYLMRGWVDALFDRQQYTLPYVAKTMDIDGLVRVINAPEPERPFYIVFSKAVDKNASVVEKIDRVMATGNPNYLELVKKQFEKVE